MKPLNKKISVNKLLNKADARGVFKILTASLFSLAAARPMVANAQSSACAANKIALTYSFAAPNNWAANHFGVGCFFHTSEWQRFAQRLGSW